MKNVYINREPVVHVFGVPGITRCTPEENKLLFNGDLNNVKDILILKNVPKSTFRDSFVFNEIEKILNHIKRNKQVYFKIIKVLAVTLLMVSEPTNAFALSLTSNTLKDIMESIGNDLFDCISTGAVKGLLVITIIRLFGEYTRGGSKYKSMEIIKQFVVVIVLIVILPLLPSLVNSLVTKYFEV